MTIQERFNERYQTGETPWDIGKPDFNLIEVISQTPVPVGRALEIGCGTGDNTIWLAQNGFQIIGGDTADSALESAREKAGRTGAQCEFVHFDILKDRLDKGFFSFAFDCGCFHAYASEMDRRAFAHNVAGHLQKSGLWLTIVGSADEKRDAPGPPRRTAAEIVLAVEPYFEILSLTTSHFSSKRSKPPRAWRCLLKKRSTASEIL